MGVSLRARSEGEYRYTDPSQSRVSGRPTSRKLIESEGEFPDGRRRRGSEARVQAAACHSSGPPPSSREAQRVQRARSAAAQRALRCAVPPNRTRGGPPQDVGCNAAAARARKLRQLMHHKLPLLSSLSPGRITAASRRPRVCPGRCRCRVAVGSLPGRCSRPKRPSDGAAGRSPETQPRSGQCVVVRAAGRLSPSRSFGRASWGGWEWGLLCAVL